MTRRSSALERLLVVVGGVLVALGVLAGHVNRQVLDGPTFAGNVDEVRRDDAVAAALGRSITTQLVAARPDLVALRPLVQSVATSVAGGELLSGPTRLAAATAHKTLTEADSDAVVLRIADAGAVVVAVLQALEPERTPLPTSVGVTLASIGDQRFAAATIAVARAVGVLAWLLPSLAVLAFAGAIASSKERWRTAAAIGWALVWAAIAIGALLVVGGIVVRRLDDDTLGGAVGRAGWDVFVRPLWWGVAVLGVIGATVVLACASSAPAAVARTGARLRDVVRRRPERPVWVLARAAIAVVVGIAAVADPLGLLEPLIAAAGIGLLLFAMTEIGALASARRAEADGAEAPTSRRATRRVLVGVAAVAVAIAGTVVLARPGRDVSTAAPVADGTTCNGHVELCDRRFDEVAYVSSHNAMSVAREAGWFLPEQLDPIPTQLDQGVRALLVDVWSGRPAGAVVRTAEGSYAEALAVAEADLGRETVDAALRLADAIAGPPQGPEARYLCHGLCETGSTPFLDSLAGVRGWLERNPREVLTLFIEDHVDAALIAADVETAGLLPYVATPPAVGTPWPSLGDMIESGRRLVVMVETGRGGDEAPWLVNGFEVTQETPYTFPTVESFSCEPNRGPADAPLLLLNHWLAGFSSLVTDAALVNDRDVLLTRAEQCQEERDLVANFVAVNFVAIGDVVEVVDELNGVG